MSAKLGMLATMVLSATGLLAGQQNEVTRLDGSKIEAVEVDRTVTQLMKAAEVTGVGLAILNDGKIEYLKAYGVRYKENNQPMTVD